LGGFTEFDFDGMSPRLWRFLMTNWTVKSVVDVGCGRGVSSSWFYSHGARVLCVEGSHDAVERSVLPQDHIVEHDFTRGPWWPQETFDLAWSVEFLEHVGRPYMGNYQPIFHRAAILCVSHSTWGGWHHVEAHMREWWIHKFQSLGFVYMPDLTDVVKAIAKSGSGETCEPTLKRCPKHHTTGAPAPFSAQHLQHRALVFLNPRVASLPQHDHLFHEDGCAVGLRKWRPCGSFNSDILGVSAADALPERYLPLPSAQKDDKEWQQKLFG